MENVTLKKLIIDFREGDVQAFAVIYEEFRKMVYYYSRKIGNEDAYQELMIFLIELLYNIELSRFPNDKNDNLKRYIAVSLRNKYIVISKKKRDEEKVLIGIYDDDVTYNYNGEDIMLKEMLETLSDKQRRIVVYRYIYGYSDSEIANCMGISRQAVFRLRNRAFRLLREIYC